MCKELFSTVSGIHWDLRKLSSQIRGTVTSPLYRPGTKTLHNSSQGHTASEYGFVTFPNLSNRAWEAGLM